MQTSGPSTIAFGGSLINVDAIALVNTPQALGAVAAGVGWAAASAPSAAAEPIAAERRMPISLFMSAFLSFAWRSAGQRFPAIQRRKTPPNTVGVPA